jgi:hypothetical protein
MLAKQGMGFRFWDDLGGSHNRFVRSRAPLPPEDHYAAWTEAASLCAEYFGIDEELVPSVLILSFWEKAAILVRLQSHMSLYELIKVVRGSLGDKPRKLARLRHEIERLDQSIHDMRHKEKTWMKANRPFAEWRAKLGTVDRQLEQTTGIDPALIERCQGGLRKWRDSGQVDDLPADLPIDLRALHVALQSPNSSSELHHSQVWGLILRLESDNPLPGPHTEPEQYSQPIRELEAQLGEARDQERVQRAALHLSDAIITGYNDLFPPTRTTRTSGSAGLTGWTLCTIERDSRSPLGVIGRPS